jgi:hypothetical protein
MATTPLWTVFVTASAALLGVGLGALLQVHRDKRSWQREHAQHWIETRLDIYKEFIVAHREYLAYVMQESTQIKATAHPHLTERMPIFDAEGRLIRQRQEAAFTALRLVAVGQDTERAMARLVTAARQVACARADHSDPKNVDSELFVTAQRFERQFINSARKDLGLQPLKREYGSNLISPGVTESSTPNAY